MTGEILKFGADRGSALASSSDPAGSPDFQFERPEWTLFRSVDTLSQKAGVPRPFLRRLVLKEIADNALDSGATVVTVEQLDADTFRIADNGRGIRGEPDDIARLFSINRPLVSSKLWRLPSRGAMGNGLRVVVGSVAASDGRLVVTTGGRRHELTPTESGATSVNWSEAEDNLGTVVEIRFGATIPPDDLANLWARMAVDMAEGGETYAGRPSPWWYDADAFFELLQASGNRPVRDFVGSLDGCTGARAGKIAQAFKTKACSALNRTEAHALLMTARVEAKKVRPERLGGVGLAPHLPAAYGRQRGEVEIGGRSPKASIPFVVEAWANAVRPSANEIAYVRIYVNRTPVAAMVKAYCAKKELTLIGCGLSSIFTVPAGNFDVFVNLTTPWCPVTTDGKEPDLSHFADEIGSAILTAARRAKSSAAKLSLGSGLPTHKAVVLANLEEAVAKASGDGEYRFNQRQLFYVLRPYVQGALGSELMWGNFQAIVTDYESAHGEIVGMYRDPRGTLYHPHLGQDITLGTLAVEDYERPEWTFSQILYIEKEGFFEALKAAQWPERHDCALVTSKGFTTRAVRDLLDLLGDGGEPIRVFCVHDADAFGTMIFQTLGEETKARGRRRVEVINLGLDPWEAVDMGLAPEAVSDSDRRKPVADYVLDRDDGDEWLSWLQETRVELNEMTTPQFIAWLDAKMASFGAGKVIPPETVLVDEAERRLAAKVRGIVTERVLREARTDDQVAGALTGLSLPDADSLKARVAGWLDEREPDPWTAPVDAAADEVADTIRG